VRCGEQLWQEQRARWLRRPQLPGLPRNRSPSSSSSSSLGLQSRSLESEDASHSCEEAAPASARQQAQALSAEDRTSVRRVLACDQRPFPALRRTFPLAAVIGCALELWHDDDDDPMPVWLAKTARTATSDALHRTLSLGATLGELGRGALAMMTHVATGCPGQEEMKEGEFVRPPGPVSPVSPHDRPDDERRLMMKNQAAGSLTHSLEYL